MEWLSGVLSVTIQQPVQSRQFPFALFYVVCDSLLLVSMPVVGKRLRLFFQAGSTLSLRTLDNWDGEELTVVISPASTKDN